MLSFDDVVTSAGIVLVGTTPGAQQAVNAAKAGMLAGWSDAEVSTAKSFA